jgi:negative regulator of sigma-B (phosphoserine phosphatase)
VRRSNRPPPLLDAPTTWTSEEPRVSLAWISRPRVGEIENGDRVIVRRRGSGVLVVVVDALGHGPKAASVAASANELVNALPEADGVTDVIDGLHQALTGQRGAAALAFFVSNAGVEACSVGNVELRAKAGRLPLVLTAGVLGVRLRSPRTVKTVAPCEERFVFYSDGISGRFDLKAQGPLTPSELATHIFKNHRHTHDDSTVVVADLSV